MLKKAVLFVIIIVIAYTVVSITTGSPIKRVQFRSNVTDYLHKMYTMNWKIDSVDYDFKNDKFIANVSSGLGISFLVEEDYYGQMMDNYACSIWMDEVKTAVTKTVKEVTGSDAEVIVDIYSLGSHTIIYRNEIPSYSTVSRAFSSNATILIKGNFSATHYLQEMLEIKQWIVEKKYDASLTFKSEKGKIYFAIPAEDLKKIRSVDDFKPYWLQIN
ncbi:MULTISPECIES: hypothetical protein [Paenibacillus]|uniref:Uncharacterized protein n=2 Tax=Paenibacillus TaxID=44249 RepID=A0ABX2ZB22_PAEPO|nr:MULTISPECIES: hypothetical protein [Paenibacillus]AHC22719.1 hypothetical protein X809_07575 [Paenibacillus polymyxa CR1]MDR6777786.1 hypothetical protein [Paenibacillus peoriae]ODA08655.1 hypothetical protein A7312_04420 [Paenibacillus polymyxa]OME66014.1 hypothetical protein BK119_24110 [Paenibacillus peoriae]